MVSPTSFASSRSAGTGTDPRIDPTVVQDWSAHFSPRFRGGDDDAREFEFGEGGECGLIAGDDFG